MNRNHSTVFCVLLTVFIFSGCATFPRYQRVTDGLDRRQYQVLGQVVNSFQKPVVECQIYLTKRSPSCVLGQKQYVVGEEQYVPVAITDQNGDYSFSFELDGASEFYLYLDAGIQGYKVRYLDITHLFTSELFQYTGNNPVIVNAVLIPDRIEIRTDKQY
jgi:hypothetical protein